MGHPAPPVKRQFVRFEFARERFVCAVGCSPPPELIDGRVPQRSVKPRHDSFVRWRLFRARDHSRERVLEDVFGQRAIADTPLEIS